MQSKICPSTKSEAGNSESWHSFYENLTLQIIHVLWDWLRTGEDNRSRLVQWGKPKDHCLPSWMIPSSSETLLSSNSIKWACLHANTILMYLEFIQKRSLASKTAYLALLGVLSPGEGNGCPLQYSCLDNSMDRGPWWGGGYRPWGHKELDTTVLYFLISLRKKDLMDDERKGFRFKKAAVMKSELPRWC